MTPRTKQTGLSICLLILGALTLSLPQCNAQTVGINSTEAVTQRKLPPPGCNNTAQLVRTLLSFLSLFLSFASYRMVS